jgi:hypothetical protein
VGVIEGGHRLGDASRPDERAGERETAGGFPRESSLSSTSKISHACELDGDAGGPAAQRASPGDLTAVLMGIFEGETPSCSRDR